MNKIYNPHLVFKGVRRAVRILKTCQPLYLLKTGWRTKFISGNYATRQGSPPSSPPPPPSKK